MSDSRYISKKLRFEVFKRDAFTCVYCGRTPPTVTLQPDHVVAFSKGGKSELENLATSCVECNAGKSDRALDKVPNPLTISMEELREREYQMAEYERLLQAVSLRKDKQINQIAAIVSAHFPNQILSNDFRISIRTRFLDQLPHQVLLEAMQIACSKKYSAYAAAKYFCGICWNKIHEGFRRTPFV